MRINTQFIMNCKKVRGRFGFEEEKELPCTFGMNDRGGMNAVELDKYMKAAVFPLYPDAQDENLQRVIVKADVFLLKFK